MHPPLEGQWSHLCLSPSCWNLVQNILYAQGLYFRLKWKWKHWIENRITNIKNSRKKTAERSLLSRTLWIPLKSILGVCNHSIAGIVRTGYMYSAGCCCCRFVCFASLYKASPVTKLFKGRRILLAIKAIFHSKRFAPRFVLKQNRNKNSEIACWLHISIFF